jgi:hypothetical protein
MSCPFSYQFSDLNGQERVTDCWVVQWVDFLPSHCETPHIIGIPRNVEYLNLYFREWEYTEIQKQAEMWWTFKREMCDSLRKIQAYIAAAKSREIHITLLQPAIDWSPVWGNLLNTILFDGVRSTWCMVIHDTLSINVWLHRIRLLNTENCTQCGRQETI